LKKLSQQIDQSFIDDLQKSMKDLGIADTEIEKVKQTLQQAVESQAPGEPDEPEEAFPAENRELNTTQQTLQPGKSLASLAFVVRYLKTAYDAKEIGERIGINWDEVEFTPDDLKKGIEVEKEHGPKDEETDVTGGDLETTAKIAWAHLKESSDYYNLLEDMEKSFD